MTHANEGLNPAAFKLHRAIVRGGTELAFVREGIGGVPILLMHGWPATKRIFYRNVEALARAGFEVVVPDASGWGDSPVPEGRYADFTSSALDFVALMESLGHSRWVLGAFDFGSLSALHMVNRFPAKIIRFVLWNGAVPQLPEEWERAGIGGEVLAEDGEQSDHIRNQGQDPDRYVKRFRSDEERVRYVMGFYQGRAFKEGGPLLTLAAPGSFDDETARFHAEPFANASSFRASMNYYAALLHPDLAFEPLQNTQKIDVETLFMYGIEDKLVGVKSARRAELGFTNLVGPFLIPGGGHFLCWERARVVNNAIISFCRELLTNPARQKQEGVVRVTHL